MLGCDDCHDWFHYECVGLRPPGAPGNEEEEEQDAPENFRCPMCCMRVRPWVLAWEAHAPRAVRTCRVGCCAPACVQSSCQSAPRPTDSMQAGSKFANFHRLPPTSMEALKKAANAMPAAGPAAPQASATPMYAPWAMPGEPLPRHLLPAVGSASAALPGTPAGACGGQASSMPASPTCRAAGHGHAARQPAARAAGAARAAVCGRHADAGRCTMLLGGSRFPAGRRRPVMLVGLLPVSAHRACAPAGMAPYFGLPPPAANGAARKPPKPRRGVRRQQQQQQQGDAGAAATPASSPAPDPAQPSPDKPVP